MSQQKRLTKQDAVALLQAPLDTLRKAAHACRNAWHPQQAVTFVLDSNPNYTNVCTAYCSFCAFYRPPGHQEAYTLTVQQVMKKIDTAVRAGCSTILLQGGLHPHLPLSYYTALLTEAKQQWPDLFLHFFSAPEIANIAKVNNISIRQTLRALYQAGQRTLPGGGAEIITERVRQKISPLKMFAGGWVHVHRLAHEEGFHSTATMMYGHVEKDEDIVEHLDKIRALQDITGRFTAFIPWSYKPENTALRRHVSTIASVEKYWRILAVARLYLDNIPHIQASWFSEGKEVGQTALSYGADDFGGLILEENVHKAANFVNKSSIEKIVQQIHAAGFDAVERDPMYRQRALYPRSNSPLTLCSS